MSFLGATFGVIKRIFGFSQGTHGSRRYQIQKDTLSGVHKQPLHQQDGLLENPDEQGQHWLGRLGQSKKRKASEEYEEPPLKRDRRDMDGAEHAELARRPTAVKSDRDLMPPPATLLIRRTSSGRENAMRRESIESIDTFSEARTQRTKLMEVDNDYDMEAARRRAAATQLPPNSGTWEPAERDLFFHLAYRGFEPLLPNNWMIDFPTLPISLFATHQDQIPLIEAYRSTEFRAIKALRDLMDTGKLVRDRTISTSNDLRCEPIINKAINSYIKWALKDFGISRRQCIAVHAVVTMKHGENTQDTIRDLTGKMHRLSARHRRACDVLTSVEVQQRGKDQDHNSQTYLHDDTSNGEHQLPVIYGLMVCSSLLAVFTLSSHTPSPSFIRTKSRDTRKDERGNGPTDPHEIDEGDEDSGLRFIASFDFSDSASDVWNALVIAIVAVMIRNSLADIYEIPTTVVNEKDLDESVLEASLLDADLESNHDRYVARYAMSGALNSVTKNTAQPVGSEADIDPDL